MKKTILKVLIAVLIFVFSFSLAMIVSTHNIKDNIGNEKATQNSKEGASQKNKDKANKTEKPTKEQSTLLEATPTEIATTELGTEFQEEMGTEESTLFEEELTEITTMSQEIYEKNQEVIGVIAKEYCSIEELESRNCKQLIIVKSFSNDADVCMFEKDDSGVWNRVDELSTTGFVGSAGVSPDSYEGSYQTPAGLFAVGDMFYIEDKPETNLRESFQITENTYWIDDPASKSYNKKVEGTDNMDWNSAEHMIDYYFSYKYGFVIDFNTNPIRPRKGSAIFFHIGYEPTAGCVAVSEDMVLAYLERLNSAKNPYILIQ